MHLDYSQLYLHPRSLKGLANGQWYMVFGEKGVIDLDEGRFYRHGSDEVRELITPAGPDAGEDATCEVYSSISAKTRPDRDATGAASARPANHPGRAIGCRRRGA